MTSSAGPAEADAAGPEDADEDEDEEEADDEDAEEGTSKPASLRTRRSKENRRCKYSIKASWSAEMTPSLSSLST